MPYHPRIAIVGAGPSGLALTLLLQQQNHRVTVYERRDAPTPADLARPSGMLDLHEESGLQLIRACELWDAFTRLTGECSEEWRVLDAAGTVLHADQGELEPRPEIARNALTGLLLGRVRDPSATVRWGYKVTHVQRLSSSSTTEAPAANVVTLDVAGPSGTTETAEYDLVVGADGAWSRVRPLVAPAAVPFYSGAHLVCATLRHASATHPRLLPLVGTGTMNALGHRHGIMSQRGPHDSIRVYAVVTQPDARWARSPEIRGKSAAELKATVLLDPTHGVFRGWCPELRDLLATACDEDAADNPHRPAEVWPLHMLPVDHRWTTDPTACVTLVGDAAHLMTPWAGEGVNLALWDALDLARAITAAEEEEEEGGEDIEDAAAWHRAFRPRLAEFEERMFARSQDKARETDENRAKFLGENGAEAMADMFKTVFAGVQASTPAPGEV